MSKSLALLDELPDLLLLASLSMSSDRLVGINPRIRALRDAVAKMETTLRVLADVLPTLHVLETDSQDYLIKMVREAQT